MPKQHSKRHRSSKGALIKGMSKRLSSDLLDDPLFRNSLKNTLKGYAGIYGLYRGQKLYYTGLTGNLLARIKWHQKDRHKNKWDHFVIFRIQRIRYLKDIETLILHLVEPPGNRVKGKLPKDADLNRILRTTLSEYRKRIRGYTKTLR